MGLPAGSHIVPGRPLPVVDNGTPFPRSPASTALEPHIGNVRGAGVTLQRARLLRGARPGYRRQLQGPQNALYAEGQSTCTRP